MTDLAGLAPVLRGLCCLLPTRSSASTSSTDVVVLAGMEGPSVLVVPGLVCLVFVAHEDGAAIPIVGLAAQVVAALEQQDALARGRKPVGERSAASAAADDDHVVVAVHGVRSGQADGR